MFDPFPCEPHCSADVTPLVTIAKGFSPETALVSTSILYRGVVRAILYCRPAVVLQFHHLHGERKSGIG